MQGVVLTTCYIYVAPAVIAHNKKVDEAAAEFVVEIADG